MSEELPPTMRSIQVSEHGDADQLRLRDDVPLPEAGPGQALVRVAAAGVNFIDVYVRTGRYPAELPYQPGKEGAGTVVALGEGVSEFAAGDRVAWAMVAGGYGDYAVVDVNGMVAVPECVGDETAAAVMLQGLTAHFLTHSIVPVGDGDDVLVHAGAGGVGLLLTQLLVRAGARVLSVTSTPEKATLSREAGAAVTLGYDDLAARVREETDGRGVRAVFDGVGASTFDASLDSLAVRGTLVLFGAASGAVPPVDPMVLAQKGSLMLTRPTLNHFMTTREELGWRAGEVFDAIAAGELDVRIGQRYALADAAQAHRDLEGRRTTGKLILVP